jgi:hypothetical protein
LLVGPNPRRVARAISVLVVQAGSLATGRGYSMSFCFLISDVVSAAIAPTSRGMLSGL